MFRKDSPLSVIEGVVFIVLAWASAMVPLVAMAVIGG
jgi:hypothetical protein